MKKKNLSYVVLCALSSMAVGFFANQLSEIYGCVLFGIGIVLMAWSTTNLSK